jgi:hypothetical protein
MSNVMTPNTLAEKLAGSAQREKVGKTFVRPLLRRHFPRDIMGTSWYLNDTQIAFITAAWKAKQKGVAFDASAYLKAHKTRKPKVVTPEAVNDSPTE